MKDGKYVILCIDDDPDILDWLETVLQSAGYGTAVAANAEAGRRRYKESDPDLIIVDLMMEEIDSGAAFVKELKAQGNLAPIYLLSAAGDELNMTADYTELGLDGVFQKPLNPDSLLSILRQKLK